MGSAEQIPLVTIVTPVLNQRAYVESTLRSVLEQDYPNIEYIVVDGGSTDGTLEVLAQYQDRIRLISEKDTGQANAINKGFFLGRGEILAWLNADDIYLPGAVSAAAQAFNEKPESVLVYGDCAYIGPDGEIISAYPSREFDLRSLIVEGENFIPQPAAFFKRKCMDEAGYLNEELNYVLDYELWLRFTSVGGFRYLQKRLAHTRLHAGAKSVTSFDLFGEELLGVIEAFYSQSDLPVELQQTKEESLSKASLRAAHASYWAGEYRTALQQLKGARWDFLSNRQKITRLYLFLFGIAGRFGLPLNRLLPGNPYTFGRHLGNGDG